MSGESDPNNVTVFIGGIDENVTYDVLKNFFSLYGEVTNIKIPLSKGCAFVEYSSHESAVNALKTLGTGAVIGNLQVRLAWGKPTSQSTGQNQNSSQADSPYLEQTASPEKRKFDEVSNQENSLETITENLIQEVNETENISKSRITNESIDKETKIEHNNTELITYPQPKIDVQDENNTETNIKSSTETITELSTETNTDHITETEVEINTTKINVETKLESKTTNIELINNSNLIKFEEKQVAEQETDQQDESQVAKKQKV